MGIVIVLMATLLMSAIGAALTLTTATEATVAGHFVRLEEARGAAAGALELGVAEIRGLTDWNGLLDGSVRSAFTDGPPAGPRAAGGERVDLTEIVALLNCGRLTACSDVDMDASTDARPWGPNNPRWRPFRYGPLSVHLGLRTACYVIVLAADDAAETDGDPERDGLEGQPGAGRLRVRAEAFCAAGAHSAVDAIVERHPDDGARLRVLARYFTRGPVP